MPQQAVWIGGCLHEKTPLIEWTWFSTGLCKATVDTQPGGITWASACWDRSVTAEVMFSNSENRECFPSREFLEDQQNYTNKQNILGQVEPALNVLSVPTQSAGSGFCTFLCFKSACLSSKCYAHLHLKPIVSRSTSKNTTEWLSGFSCCFENDLAILLPDRYFSFAF